MRQEYIKIVGANENNLKNVSLTIPKRKISIFTGVSGSGKSSIVFDTIAQEAGRQLNQNFSAFVQNYLPKYHQPSVESIENLSMVVAVGQSRIGGNSRSTLGTITDINPLIRLLFSRMGQPAIGPAWNFSFNDPHGMCPTCEGLGRVQALDLAKALDWSKSLSEGAILLPGFKVGGWQHRMYVDSGFFDKDKPIEKFTDDEIYQLLHVKDLKIESLFMEGMQSNYEGLVVRFNKQISRDASEKTMKQLAPFIVDDVCPDCDGTRFNDRVLSVQIKDLSIADYLHQPLGDLKNTFENLFAAEDTSELVKPVLTSLIKHLSDLIDIGLDYLSLDRETSTLSGGESQRVKMVKELNSALVDVIYVFDEPSVGLHPRDVHRLNELLQKLRDKGNTVIVVEHDPDVIKVADYVVDVGPLAGKSGGEITFTGTFSELKDSDTITGKGLRSKSVFKKMPRTPENFIQTMPSSLNNLRNQKLRVPEGLFTVVTGVAGSGKSSLVHGVFAKEHPEAILIDQSAVGANSRSNPATYSGIFDEVRKLFAATNEVAAGLFSYNSIGACEACKGQGVIGLELAFMEGVEVECQECGGLRYKQEVYQYLFKGKNISEVLHLTITEAFDFFEGENKITNKLKQILDVGLGYMTLGQPLSTLSGGENQRLKLAKELSKKGNIYIMDEPTTGLHMANINDILTIIEKLVKKGNTVVVIEHNTDVIRAADWLIDVGPDGGTRGGCVLYEGHPIHLKLAKESITGKYL